MSISSKKILPATIQQEEAKFFSYITDNTPFSITQNNFFFTDMCLDSEGNIYIVGGERSDYPMKFGWDDPCTLYDFFAMKLNSNYEVQWQKTMGNLPAGNCCLIGSNSGNEYLVIGHVGSYGNCSVSTMNMSTGAFVDQKRYDNSAGSMYSVQKIIPDPSVDGRFHTVGSVVRATSGRESAAGGLITINSSGTLSPGYTFRIQYWSARNDNSSWYDVLYDDINDYYIAVGQYQYANQPNDLATVGSPNFATEFLNAKILNRDNRETNSFISSINMDSSGYKYTTHTDGYIQKVNWNSTSTYATTTAEWRVQPTSIYDSQSSCSALSSNENYLYVGTRNCSLLKIATSDGSLIGKMAWPNVDAASDSNYRAPDYRDSRGIQKIYVQDGKIYILLNAKSTMSSAAGNLIVIPESSFGTEMRLGNGNGLVNADQTDLYTGAGLNCTELATLTYENTSITTTTFSYVSSDVTNNTFTEIPNNTEGPMVIYGTMFKRNGTVSTNFFDRVITEDLPQSSAYQATFIPKEGDIILYVGAMASSTYYGGILDTGTSGYSRILFNYSNDTSWCEMTVQWKRMGASPDTTIKFPYNNGSTSNSSVMQVMVLRDFNSDATPYAENSYTRTRNTNSSTAPSLTLTNDSIVFMFHTNGQQATIYGYGISDNSYNDYVNANHGQYQGDTYDCSLIFGNTGILSSGTNFAPTGKPVFPSDSTLYSSLAFSIAFPVG